MEGTIPNEIGMLNKLNTLSLTNGKILGPIPDTMYNIQTLETLQLNNNEITGELPKALYTMKNLKILHLNNNKLRGRIQSDIGLLGNSLMSLRLDNNYFDGLIRRELKDLVRLSKCKATYSRSIINISSKNLTTTFVFCIFKNNL